MAIDEVETLVKSDQDSQSEICFLVVERSYPCQARHSSCNQLISMSDRDPSSISDGPVGYKDYTALYRKSIEAHHVPVQLYFGKSIPFQERLLEIYVDN